MARLICNHHPLYILWQIRTVAFLFLAAVVIATTLNHLVKSHIQQGYAILLSIGIILTLSGALLDAPWKAGAVLLLYFIIQQVEGNFVTPIVMQHQVNLPPATTLALLTAFGIFFDPLGLLLGLPILVIAQTWLEEAIVHDILDHWKSQ